MTGKPILLAEDNENDAVLFKHQLAMATVCNPLQVVTDGEQLIDYLDGQRQYADRSQFPLPVILFLDLRMPKIGGHQILSFLQANPTLKSLPVIVLSVLGGLKDVTEAYRRGAKSFCIKPLDVMQLLQTLGAIPGLHLRPENGGLVLEETDQPPAQPGIVSALQTILDEPPKLPPEI